MAICAQPELATLFAMPRPRVTCLTEVDRPLVIKPWRSRRAPRLSERSVRRYGPAGGDHQISRLVADTVYGGQRRGVRAPGASRGDGRVHWRDLLGGLLHEYQRALPMYLCTLRDQPESPGLTATVAAVSLLCAASSGRHVTVV